MALPIGGFMPIPLAMMIPFMATQSMVMGDAFGRAFQYGKRKISAMSNEEFNATSIEQQAANMFESYKLIIPKLNDAIDASSELQRKIISEMLLILPKFISETGTEIFGGTDIRTEIDDHAHSINRAHTHSGGPPTIIGTTTSNGITTTHYSDGTTTIERIHLPSSGPAIIPIPPPNTSQIDLIRKNIEKNLNQLRKHLKDTKATLANTIGQTQRGSQGSRAAAARKISPLKQTIVTIQKEIDAQQEQLARLNRGEKPY